MWDYRWGRKRCSFSFSRSSESGKLHSVYSWTFCGMQLVCTSSGWIHRSSLASYPFVYVFCSIFLMQGLTLCMHFVSLSGLAGLALVCRAATWPQCLLCFAYIFSSCLNCFAILSATACHLHSDSLFWPLSMEHRERQYFLNIWNYIILHPWAPCRKHPPAPWTLIKVERNPLNFHHEHILGSCRDSLVCRLFFCVLGLLFSVLSLNLCFFSSYVWVAHQHISPAFTMPKPTLFF